MKSAPTKAVIAAAGFGTRLLPQTKAIPKEMLPLVDKPVIQYVVEELVAVGITDIVIVTSQSKRSIEDHFDLPKEDLLAHLRRSEADNDWLSTVQDIARAANFVYVRQKGAYGNAAPLLAAAPWIGDEPFLYTWGDDFIEASPSRFQQLIDVYRRYNGSVLAALRATHESDYSRYCFAVGELLDDGVMDTSDIVVRPGKEQARSDLATTSGCLLTPEIFPYLRRAQEENQGDSELYYRQILTRMMRDGKKVYTTEIQAGRYYDTGSKLAYAQAVVAVALRHPEIGEAFRDYLEKIVSDLR